MDMNKLHDAIHSGTALFLPLLCLLLLTPAHPLSREPATGCPLLPRRQSCKDSKFVAAARKNPRTSHCFQVFQGGLLGVPKSFEQHGLSTQVEIGRSRHPAKSKVEIVNIKLPQGRKLFQQAAPVLNLTSAFDWRSCAVIGSSNSITGKRMGKKIDTASVVIRFNDAPCKGHTADVGSKTSLRIQNFMYCGYHEEREEQLLYYFGTSAAHRGCRQVVARPEGARGRVDTEKGYHATMGMLQYAVQFFRDVDSEGREPSAGFFGILLALQLCETVNIYGFHQGSSHYYQKGYVGRQSLAPDQVKHVKGRHSWPFERKCLHAYEKVFQGRLKIQS